MADIKLVELLNKLLANTYALYLKTQNYHWHVTGPAFASIHSLLETHYTELAEAVDEIAERVVMLDGKAFATFGELNANKTVSDGNSSLNAKGMLEDLVKSHKELHHSLTDVLDKAQKDNDEVTVSLATDRLSWHEKATWMLKASI